MVLFVHHHDVYAPLLPSLAANSFLLSTFMEFYVQSQLGMKTGKFMQIPFMSRDFSCLFFHDVASESLTLNLSRFFSEPAVKCCSGEIGELNLRVCRESYE